MTKEKITNREYKRIKPQNNQIMATKELKDLVNKGFIISKGKLKSTYYILNK